MRLRLLLNARNDYDHFEPSGGRANTYEVYSDGFPIGLVWYNDGAWYADLIAMRNPSAWLRLSVRPKRLIRSPLHAQQRRCVGAGLICD
jgi:hypothetical protein